MSAARQIGMWLVGLLVGLVVIAALDLMALGLASVVTGLPTIEALAVAVWVAGLTHVAMIPDPKKKKDPEPDPDGMAGVHAAIWIGRTAHRVLIAWVVVGKLA